jgi:hypothetical protein
VGQLRPFEPPRATSGTLKADIARYTRHVSKVPQAVIMWRCGSWFRDECCNNRDQEKSGYAPDDQTNQQFDKGVRLATPKRQHFFAGMLAGDIALIPSKAFDSGDFDIFASYRCPKWVRLRRTQPEQKSSRLSPKADTTQYRRHFGYVPFSDVRPTTFQLRTQLPDRRWFWPRH